MLTQLGSRKKVYEVKNQQGKQILQITTTYMPILHQQQSTRQH